MTKDESNDEPAKATRSGLTSTEEQIIALLRNQGLDNARTVNASAGAEEETNARHLFWDTQPMYLPDKQIQSARTGETLELNAPIVPNKAITDLRADPYNMPKGFVWSALNVSDADEMAQLYDLLAKNYVEDDDCMFRFDYSIDFLMWALTPPGYDSDLHLAVRSEKTNKLVAFISAVPATIAAYDSSFESVEINFLCVHKKLRKKRLAPVLIKEITRRVNHKGVFQAVYTAGVKLPGPVSSCRYFHRSINPKKLVEVQFSRVPPKMTMARLIKQYKLPNETSLALRPMEQKDVEGVHALVTQHLNKFQLAVKFSPDEIAHWLLPRAGVIDSHVVTNAKGDVTDFVSFYHLPSTIIGNTQHTHLRAAYSFYNVATSVDLCDLMRDALILAKVAGVDVFNALNQMENGKFLEELKFGKGDGNLQYYLYNWCCPTMEANDVGIVLL